MLLITLILQTDMCYDWRYDLEGRIVMEEEVLLYGHEVNTRKFTTRRSL